MITVYGISNCDTIKKTCRYLTEQGLDWQLHDYRKQGLDQTLCDTLTSRFPLADLINRRGTTWRQLDPAQQAGLLQIDSAKALLMQHCALIKRPIIRTPDDQWLIGFDAVKTLG